MDDHRLFINSLGEGSVWVIDHVIDSNSNLENEDYIQSSDIIGYAEKQDDDILHNYTVGKITCDCNFNLDSTIYKCVEFTVNSVIYKKAFVGCVYMWG